MECGPRNLNVMAASGNRAVGIHMAGENREGIWRDSQVTGIEGMADKRAGCIHEEELNASDPAEGGHNCGKRMVR